MQLVGFDFETYYDTKTGYTLKKMTTEEYIRDDRFQAIMVAISIYDTETDEIHTRVFVGDKIAEGLATIDWANAMVPAWNNHFDAAIAAWRYGIRIKAPICAMAMWRMMGLSVHGGESLDAATRYAIDQGWADVRYKGHAVLRADGKRLNNFTFAELQEYADYCRDDSHNCTRLAKHLIDRGFPPAELVAMAEILRCFTEPRIRLNLDVLRKVHADQIRKQNETLAAAGIDPTDVGFVRSDPKFAAALQALGLEPGTKVSKRTGKTNWAFAKSDDFMFGLLSDDSEEGAAARALAEARVANKSTITESRSGRLIQIAQRGPLPIMLKPGGAHTLRLSGGDNVNPQNMEKRGLIREGLQAAAGYKLIAVDESQIELRMNAYISDQQNLLHAFREGRDIYSDYGNNSGMFPFEISKKTVDARFLCKGVVLGGGFGSGANALEAQIVKLARDLGMQIDLAGFDYEQAKTSFRRIYKQIVHNWYDTGDQLKQMMQGQSSQRGKDGLVHYVAGKGFRFPNGLYIHYHDLHYETPPPTVDMDTGELIQGNDEMWFKGVKWGKLIRKYIYPSKAVENYVQGLAGLMLREMWVEIVRRARREIGIKHGSIVLQVHDELIAQVKDEAVEDYKALMCEVMRIPPWWAPEIPLDVEASVGQTYKSVS